MKTCLTKIASINECLCDELFLRKYGIAEEDDKGNLVCYDTNGEYMQVETEGGAVFHKVITPIKIESTGCDKIHTLGLRLIAVTDKKKLCDNQCDGLALFEKVCGCVPKVSSSVIVSSEVFKRELKCDNVFTQQAISIDYTIKW